MKRLGIIGDGAWGTAVAITARRAGRDVVLWTRCPDMAERMCRTRINETYLPGIPIDPEITITTEKEAVLDVDAAFLVVPSQYVRSVCTQFAPLWPSCLPAVLCAKGIEQESLLLMSEVVTAVLPPTAPVAVLSGPTFAVEVAKGLPTAVTLACADSTLGERLIRALGTSAFRPYYSNDVVGAEIGGAVKNVLAIACGIVEGLELGDNARAALLTRGLAEILRLAQAKGGRIDTLMGLSGLGDLLLTASSRQSRNYSLGFELGRGQTLEKILSERKAVTEGVATAVSVTALAESLSLEMPICAAVNSVLHQGKGLSESIRSLLARPFKAESLSSLSSRGL